ncbi:hypothetical protein C8Q80DRAFT_367507 [Daedaleopsis nitida]|nr:hypothetical protein C8Q80DRAFT_367507 [Daedaleopsis nitida]
MQYCIPRMSAAGQCRWHTACPTSHRSATSGGGSARTNSRSERKRKDRRDVGRPGIPQERRGSFSATTGRARHAIEVGSSPWKVGSRRPRRGGRVEDGSWCILNLGAGVGRSPAARRRALDGYGAGLGREAGREDALTSSRNVVRRRSCPLAPMQPRPPSGVLAASCVHACGPVRMGPCAEGPARRDDGGRRRELARGSRTASRASTAAACSTVR